MPGRIVTFGFLLLVVTIAGGALGSWYFGREPSGQILAMTPVDDAQVVVLREGHRQHDFVHITLRDIARGQVWSIPFRDVPAGVAPVVVGGNVAAWVRNASGRLEIHAFDVAHGDFAFRAAATYVPPATDVHVSIVVSGDAIVAAASVAETRLYVIDAATGAVRKTFPLDASPEAPRLVVVSGGVRVVGSDGISRFLNPTAGTLEPVSDNADAPADLARVERGVAVLDGPNGTLRVGVSGDPAVPVGGAQLSDTRRTLWVYAGRSVAAVDVASAAVRASNGPDTFDVRR